MPHRPQSAVAGRRPYHGAAASRDLMRHAASLSPVGLASLACLLWSAWWLLGPRPAPPSGVAVASTPPAPYRIAPRAAPAVTAAAVLARPLFLPGRRAAPPEVAAPPGEAAAPVLAGTIVGPGSRLALFATPGAKRLLVRREGQRLGAGRVAVIRPGEVDTEGPQGHATWRLAGHAAPPPPPPVTPTMLHAQGGNEQQPE